ncbi:hypothetical protein V1478_006422 [Vespula squamosa]|uniref:Transmembrane protein n=1 Tax=Vespula squamosa TaxID=30214 RepID=A0ABD2B7U8_VESSQ
MDVNAVTMSCEKKVRACGPSSASSSSDSRCKTLWQFVIVIYFACVESVTALTRIISTIFYWKISIIVKFHREEKKREDKRRKERNIPFEFWASVGASKVHRTRTRLRRTATEKTEEMTSHYYGYGSPWSVAVDKPSWSNTNDV